MKILINDNTEKRKTFKRLVAGFLAASLAVLIVIYATPQQTLCSTNQITSKSTQAELQAEIQDAPKVDISWVCTFFGLGFSASAVNQYKIQPNHYYIMMIPGKSKMPYFSYRLIKVVRVYEDPTWYGSERTIDYINVEKVRFGSAKVNKGLKPPHLYEVDNFLKK